MNNSQQNFKKHCLISVSIALLLMFLIPVSFASELTSAAEDLDTSVSELIEAKDEINAEEMPIEEQVLKRKEVVSDALDLSLKEISSIKEKIASAYISEEEEELIAIKEYIINWLENEESYFKGAQDDLDAIEKDNLDAVKELAKDIKLHWEGNYIIEFKKALNFVFTLETSRLTNTAFERWDKISKDLEKIEKARLINEGYFNNEMNEAKKLIEGSRSLLSKALDSIKREYNIPKEEKELPPSDETGLKATTFNSAENIEEKQEITEEDEDVLEEESLPSPNELCEAAIINLKSGYGEFVKISIAVKKLLKLP